MSEYRAILVSREQSAILRERGEKSKVCYDLAESFYAAGDQPRIPYCAEHGYPLLPGSLRTWCVCGEQYDRKDYCRVVDAIVVPLPEQP